MATRRKARRTTLEFLYQVDLCGRFDQPGIAEALQTWREQRQLESDVVDFVQQAACGVHSHLDRIDALISAYAHEWAIDRMAVVDRNILRLALYEMLYCDDIPAGVAINEAVELAKRYGDTDSKSFVNGILAALKRDVDSGTLKGDTVCPPGS